MSDRTSHYSLVCFWLPGVSWDFLAYTKLIQSLRKALYETYTNRIPSLIQNLDSAVSKLIRSLYKAYTKLMQILYKACTRLKSSVLLALMKLVNSDKRNL